MTTRPSSNGKTKPTTRNTTAPIFEAFKEPRAWALNWDGETLKTAAKTTTTKPTTKPRA